MRIALSEVVARVILLVAKSTGVRLEEITLDTAVAADLGVAGIDGDALIWDFSKLFQVEMSGVDHSRFFDGSVAHEFQALTVGHLVRVAERGHWFDPPMKLEVTVRGDENLISGWLLVGVLTLVVGFMIGLSMVMG